MTKMTNWQSQTSAPIQAVSLYKYTTDVYVYNARTAASPDTWCQSLLGPWLQDFTLTIDSSTPPYSLEGGDRSSTAARRIHSWSWLDDALVAPLARSWRRRAATKLGPGVVADEARTA